MARSRVPGAGAAVIAAFRTVALGASVTLLANLIYESINWHSAGKTYWMSIAVAVVAILADLFELAGLLDASRTIPRAPPCLMACEDVVIAILAMLSVFPILLTDWARGGRVDGEEWPWQEADKLSLFLSMGICCYRICLSIWCCVDCCCQSTKKRRQRREWLRGATVLQESAGGGAPAGNTGGQQSGIELKQIAPPGPARC